MLSRDSLVLSPEHHALLLCARVSLDEHARGTLRALAVEGLDLSVLAQLAAQHGVTPLLARHLHDALVDLTPPEVLARLREDTQRNAVASFALTAELLALLPVLRQAGVPALAIKGPVSAALCYGDLGLRTFSDLDLLVAPRDVQAAVRVLQARGYAPHLPLEHGWLERLMRSDSELLFRHRDGERLADLHWALMPRGYSFSPGAEAPFAQRGTVRIAHAEVPTLGLEATLLFLLLHGMKHDWGSLGWLCDVAELLRRQPALDWDAVLAWSAPPGRRRFIDIGVTLAHALLDAPVPDVAMQRAAADPVTQQLAAELARSIFAPPAAPSLMQSSLGLAYFRAMELPRDRARFVHDVVLRPTPLEWRAVPLPNALAPLHYLVRPVRLAFRHAPRLATRALRRK